MCAKPCSKEKCGYPEKKWVQFLLLIELYKKPTYGYELIKKVEELTEGRHRIKTGTAYTLLRRMETANLLDSRWENSNQGPEKRVYQVTHKGREYLKSWLEMVVHRRKIIDKLTNFYNTHFKEEEEEQK
ncbi:MAG: PadR family transcriptional regulator [Patescibacteria group bacterium]